MISMRVVKKPRKQYLCANCRSVIDGEHVYLFGGEQYGKPNGIRVCAVCCLDDGDDAATEEVREFAELHLSKEAIEKARFYCPCNCDGNADHCVYAGTCIVCGRKYYGGHGYCDKESACDECRATQQCHQ